MTKELIEIFVNTGTVDRLIVAPESGITQADFPGITIEVNGSGVHDNHFHVRAKDPDGADSNNC
jgi:hypothetical protein